MGTRLFLTLALLFLPFAALAAPTSYRDLANNLVGLMNAVVALLILAAFVAYLYGLSTSLFTIGENNRTKLKTLFFWGVTVLFVMVSVWGIVRLLRDTVFSSFQVSSASHVQTSLV